MQASEGVKASMVCPAVDLWTVCQLTGQEVPTGAIENWFGGNQLFSHWI